MSEIGEIRELSEAAQVAAAATLPDHMIHILFRYCEEYSNPGTFLRCVLENNLLGACNSADNTNIRYLPAYVSWLYAHAPFECWGSVEAVEKWLDRSPPVVPNGGAE